MDALNDDRLSCAAYDYMLKLLSELWKDMKATAASKDTGIPRGPAETRPQIQVKQWGNEYDWDGGEYERFNESGDYKDDGPHCF